jgi:hypothetical protein
MVTSTGASDCPPSSMPKSSTAASRPETRADFGEQSLMSNQTFIVILRRPGKGDPRTDPFWEFGSFGCTGCHSKNLLHPKNCQIRSGDRLAFVQGGHLGFRLLLLTPPVERIDHAGDSPRGVVELRWRPPRKPFRYNRAPSIFESPAPGKRGLFPKLSGSYGAASMTLAVSRAEREAEAIGIIKNGKLPTPRGS